MSRSDRHRALGRWGLVTALVIATLTVAAHPASAATTFDPVADSYVDSANPNTNAGTKMYVKADGSPEQRAYLRFDVHGVGPSTSAVLQFYAESTNRTGVEVHGVSDNTWGEKTVTYANAPAVGAVAGASGPVTGGTWVSVDVSSLVTGDGLVTIALTTTDDTSLKITSREGVNKPQLIVPAPPSPSPFVVSRAGSTYQAVSQVTGQTYTGTLKFVVESAVIDLDESGGGTVQFTAGTFDFGSEYFKLVHVTDISFVGAGIDQTIIQNYSSAAADTEPFNFTGAFSVTVRDLTVSAGGPTRFTSDALDFDEGNDVLVERVKVTASRGRGIVFDGKNAGWASTGNTVRDCVITGTASDGIELLASSGNTITGCTITDVGGHGIQVNKASPTTDQPNKKANDNIVTGNVIDQAGQDGINVISGDNNQITNNTITNSSDDTSGRDGIRITSTDSTACDNNIVSGNIATDTQSPKTQKYGLNIASALCTATRVGPDNTFTGNLIASIRDAGTGTIFL